ncbi:hypothetical protein ACFYNL_05670 [Streptomyces sp. NPDC007808]|uniref:hypothetical protein n=1 Tax=Streptomyces sp. NPDC007808 TaxID=3364779 RepID=UPI0036ADC5D1
MLASVATGWLWLLAAATTVIHCLVMAKWVPLRRFRLAYPVTIVGCGLGTLALGQLRGLTLPALLTLYSFSLIGLTIGLLPSRKLLTKYAHELRQGTKRDSYDYPRRNIAFCVACVVATNVAAFVLTR